ncbi:DUF1491 family protein [Phaeovibrio sulfidiphilus]|uniref:DUF1491 family protein n=1 Tax=Phaeovibrio sulfidiphilus TaxID=1220600 RepID=A0A8J7CRZ8_9PROT|nr:DUF1491 family protein [Phaeovibrio sulfidiphilus]MBE1237905.1 DUF1491 family protein [Phaeovibrio sulfidiphilus]
MDTGRLKTRLFVQALIRRCEAEQKSAFLLKRGDADSGTVCLKLNGLGRGFMVLTPVRDATGAAAWMRVTGPDPVEEPAADACLESQKRMDRDLWILEIETPDLSAPLEDPIL